MPSSGLQFHEFLDTNITHVVSPGGGGSWTRSGASLNLTSGRAHGTIQFIGISEVMKKLRWAGLYASEAAAQVLAEEAKAIIDEAKDRYVPRDTGALADSGFVTKPKFSETKASVDLGFGPALSQRRRRGGRSGSEYTVPVHELPNVHHQRGSWKYLQIPLLIHAATFDKRGGEEILKRIAKMAGID